MKITINDEFEQFRSPICFMISYNENEEDVELFNRIINPIDNPKEFNDLRIKQAKRIYELYKEHKEWCPLENIEIRLTKLKNYNYVPVNNLIIYGFENGIIINNKDDTNKHKLRIRQRYESENVSAIASSIIMDDLPFLNN